jgi:filamentous hemagglutinin family protein
MGDFRNRSLLAGAILAAGGAAIAVAGPAGPSVVGGSATISGAGTGSVTINQTTPKAVINWQTFNLATGETATFNQPGASSIALNRVIGGLGPSSIDGTLTANGRVFIINGDGILIGRNASINTAGFLATTNDISNADFLAGKYNFNIPGRPSASIVNLGTITASSGGFAALVAPGVRNSGTISATLGTVSLAAGNAFTLDFYGDKLITLAVNDQIASTVIDVATGAPLKSLVSNDGHIKANGGRVELTAAAARAVVDSVINNTGVIEANSIGTKNGMIVLGAATASSKPAAAPTQTVKVSGKISAAGKDAGTTGGTVVITGENIALAGASIDVSGAAGGGKALIGGDTGGGNVNPAAAGIAQAQLESFAIPTATTLSVDSASVINASATGSGNGGKVVLWSNQGTSFAGTILATGGPLSGNGGFVETSSHGQLSFGGVVDLSAPKGKAGTWLLDPTNLNIDDEDAAAIILALGKANVTLTTSASGSPTETDFFDPSNGQGDINVGASILWTSNNTLTLSAYNNINIAPGVTIANGSVGNPASGNLILRADNSGLGTGTVNFLTRRGEDEEGPTITGRVDFSYSTGSVSIYYNPTTALCDCTSKYQSPTDFSPYVSAGSGQLTSYMLVNNADDLAQIGLNSFSLNGRYALGRDINASTFKGFSSGTTFNGLLDGNGGLGVTSSINNLTLSSSQSQNSYGLFPFIGSSGIVRNLTLQNVNISAGANTQFIGALAGQNNGTVTNVAVLSGSVSGGSFSGIGAGGLIGQNAGSITGSSAKVTVTVGDASNGGSLNIAGGLVGSNLGSIANSSSTSSVSGGAFSFVGGLAGQNGLSCAGNCSSAVGSISDSYASGPVSISGLSSSAGELVGVQAAGSTILDSQALGNVTSTANGQSQQFSVVSAGGLIGQNSGTVTSSTKPTSDAKCGQGAAFSCAGGAVSVGSLAQAGGLIGFNDGIVSLVFAGGPVTGAAGLAPTDQSCCGQTTQLGGLIGFNQGTVLYSFATGDVGTKGVAYLTAGGLIGQNIGTVTGSFAIGAANAGDNSVVGGLVGNNSPGNFTPCDGCTQGVGFSTIGLISMSYALGNVSAGNSSLVGGLAGANDGAISGSHASGDVSVIANGGFFPSFAGGLVGQNGNGGNPAPTASITSSYALGNVTGTGFGLAVGGLVGNNAAGSTVTDSQAFGSVTASTSGTPKPNANSFSGAGGLVGLNQGRIIGSSSTPPALLSICAQGASYSCAKGAVSVASLGQGGGLVGVNQGTVDSSFATGPVTGAAGVADGQQDGKQFTQIGGLIGVNQGTVTFSFATGPVGTEGVAYLMAGGLIGLNNGSVANSSATGNVSVGDFGFAGGLVGANIANIKNGCDGCTQGDGQNNLALVTTSFAGGNVSGGDFGTVGGLIGFNTGTVTLSGAIGSGVQNRNSGVADIPGNQVGTPIASGLASAGANSVVGGLVGTNAGGSITLSFALRNVNAGAFSTAGGLVGFQTGPGSIVDSKAFGSVTTNADGTQQNGFSSFSIVGGLVGQNFGLIGGTKTPTFASACTLQAAYSCAAGAVSVGSLGQAGGLAGYNDGIIQNVLATGPVTGAAGLSSPMAKNSESGVTKLGGLAGVNAGKIFNAVATGAVGTAGIGNVTAGGFVARNSGLITNASASGPVTTGDGSQAGGFFGENSQRDNTPCGSCLIGIGDTNVAAINVATASGNVTVGASGMAGGFGGANNGILTTVSATGNVSGGANSVLGGLVGGMGADGPSSVSLAGASGSVTATGANSVVGGLIGLNGGTIFLSSASGPVSGTSQSYLGGLVGINVGSITESFTVAGASVTGSGANNVVGGLTALNFGLIDPSTSAGNASSGANSVVGGLIGVNGALGNFPNGFVTGSSFPIGSVSSDSIASGNASGGAGSTVGPQIAINFATSGLPTYPTWVNSCNDTVCTVLATGQLINPNASPTPSPTPTPTPTPTPPPVIEAQLIQNLVNNFTVTTVALTDVVDTQPLTQTTMSTGQRNGPAAPQGLNGLPPQFGSRFFVPPPADPALYVKDQVVLQIPNNIPQAQLQQLMTSLGLTIMGSTPNGLLGVTSYQVQVGNGSSIASVIQTLAKFQIVAGAQANQRFFTTQEGGHELADDPTLAGLSQEGDAAQYALSKLGLIDVHRQLRGSNITVAVIDSQIDVKHPDLDGVIADSFDAVGAVEPPHAHGTGMAGAIASHRRLMGIAPSAQIFAVHAFSSGAATAESTTFSILKGLDWAASKGVRVINMSFAGPRDPSLERAIKTAHDRGIVLIAAAGNAGPKSPPLYPGADPNVIAVTATDVNDKIFSGANRGAYIAVAAPGVDILVPAPEASYQLTTGTSVASAEVSGVVALLLERNPKLTPEDVRTVLTTSARKLGANTDFGSGLVNPSKAIQTAGDFTASEITATVPPPAAAPKPPATAPKPGSKPAPDVVRSGPKPASVPGR